MSIKRSLSIALAFVGLLVGAGFASGQEVIQYFISFGKVGILGALIAGAVMCLAGAVFLQLGSYHLAKEHNEVFSEVSHPIISKFMDVVVILTLFCLGFVMLAGAGANLNQQFGLPTFVGSTVMLVMVLACGLLDVDKVSKVIGAITPLIIVAVVVAFVYAMLHVPGDFTPVEQSATAIDAPIGHWLVSAFNYDGLALMLAVSMVLVIGGDNSNPREAGMGGLIGGVMYLLMMLAASVALYFNIEQVGKSDLPMLELFAHIHPSLGYVMTAIIFLVIFNTAIGMFYALGKRLSGGKQGKFFPYFVVVSLLGYAVSFLGFKALMQYVYPVLGYLGIVLVLVLIFGWARDLGTIRKESTRRKTIRDLLYRREHPDEQFSRKDAKKLKAEVTASNIENKEIHQTITNEVSDQLTADHSVDYDGADPIEPLASTKAERPK